MFLSLVVGLGNPGREYVQTRHNIGFVVLDAFAARAGAVWRRAPAGNGLAARWDRGPEGVLWLLKPQSYVNESGPEVRALMDYLKMPVERVGVVYDDLTMETLRTKVSVGGSAGGHNGVDSLIRCLPPGFSRYRIGIGSRPHPEMELKDFVLGRFPAAEQEALEARLPSLLEGLLLLVDRGPDHAMTVINRTQTQSQ